MMSAFMPRPTSVRLTRQHARAHFKDTSRRRGLLVAFEGPDGSGKTTQRKLFKTWLQAQGYDVVSTKWNSSELIKPLIKSRKAVRALNPEEFSLLHAADFRHRVEHVILPALWAGKLVIADRFLFTALARDVARGLDLDWVLKLYQPLLWPDMVFYFAVSPMTSGKRVSATRMPNFYEAGSGRELSALHQPRDPRVRIARADLQLHHRRRRAVDCRAASPDSRPVPGG
jgi:dTMP kinase